MIDKAIYTIKNIKELRKEIKEFIDYTPENAEKLLNGWVKLKNPPPNFFKAFWLEMQEQSVWEEEETKKFQEKLLNENKINIIQMLLGFQVFELEEFYYTSLKTSNLKMLEALIQEDKFFLTPTKAEEIYFYCYSSKNPAFFYQAEKLLRDNDIYFENSNLYSIPVSRILSLILDSEQFEYIDYFKQITQVELKTMSLERFYSFWESSLRHGEFYDMKPLTQCQFIDFTIQNQTKYKAEDVVETYITSGFRREQKDSVVKTFALLVDNKIIDLNFIKDKMNFKHKEELLMMYEKYQLEQTVIDTEKSSTKKLKL